MKPGERKNCDACGVPLVGAVHHNTGKVAPIKVTPDPAGNIVLSSRDVDGARVLTYGIVTSTEGLMNLRAIGHPLFVNHFYDCPERERFRSPLEKMKAQAKAEAAKR